MLSVIQVGVGGFGNCWLNVIKRHPERARFAALVDLSAENLAKAAALVGVPAENCFASFDEALRKVDANAVICVTPPAHHRAVCVKALRAGKHVITEKPLADTMANGKAMATAAGKAGGILMVSQNYRFARWARTMRKLLESEILGKPGACIVRFYKDPRFSGFRAEMPYPLIIDMSIHHFDLLRYITGSDPAEVAGRSWNPPWSVFKGDPSSILYFTMASGLPVVYDATWASRGPETPWNGDWEFECERGQLAYRGDKIYITQDGQTAEYTDYVEMPWQGQDFTLMEFIDAIASGRQPETHAGDNLGSIAMVFAAVKAVQTGRPVKIG